MAYSLINQDAEIFREYFEECLELWGIPALYFQCKDENIPMDKQFTVLGEMSKHYYAPLEKHVIFEATPKVQTLRKLGWVTELDKEQPIVHVEYNLPGLTRGAVFKIKDPMSLTDGRLFRVTKMSLGILYPASIACQIVAVLGKEPEETLHPYDGPKSIFLNKKEGLD